MTCKFWNANSFYANVPFLYPLKMSEIQPPENGKKPKFWHFQGACKLNVGLNWIKKSKQMRSLDTGNKVNLAWLIAPAKPIILYESFVVLDKFGSHKLKIISQIPNCDTLILSVESCLPQNEISLVSLLTHVFLSYYLIYICASFCLILTLETHRQADYIKGRTQSLEDKNTYVTSVSARRKLNVW